MTIKEIISNYLGKFVALEPCYKKRGGNSVCLYTRDGELYEVERRMLSMLNSIAACYNANLALLRKNYGLYLACR